MNKRLKTNIAFVVALLCIVLVPYGVGRALCWFLIPPRGFSTDASIFQISIAYWMSGVVGIAATAAFIWLHYTLLRMIYTIIEGRINRQ